MAASPARNNDNFFDLCDSSPEQETAREPIRVDSHGAILLFSDNEEEDDDNNDDQQQRKRPAVNKAAPTSNKRSKPSDAHDDEQASSQNSTKKPPSAAVAVAAADADADAAVASSSNKENVGENSMRAFRPNVAYAAKKQNKNDDDDDDDDNDDDGDDDVCLVGTKGTNAITDFPHSRENCVLKPIDSDPKKMCPQCYCYVCDVPASTCKVWDKHCQARHKDRKWQRERELVRLAGGPERAQLLLQTQKPAAAAVRPAQVLPVRAQASTLSKSFPAYSSSSTSSLSPELRQLYRSRQKPSEYSVKALLQEVTAIYASERNPSAKVTTVLKHYQKQSLAFMLDVEGSNDETIAGTHGGYRTRGGWLSSEVGMGKTLITIALVASDEGRVLPSLDLNRNCTQLSQQIKVKATVVVTSVSLLGQWEDEVRKHAPSLKCYRFHPSSRSSYKMNLCAPSEQHPCRHMVETADIIITSATFNFQYQLGEKYEFNRVCVDESHLMGSSSMKHGPCLEVVSQRRWCISATPCVSSMRELSRQAHFLGFDRNQRFSNVSMALSGNKLDKKIRFYAAIDLLKKVMIRHQKNQQINGANALALPDSTTRKIIVKMNEEERRIYDERKNGISSGYLENSKTRGVKPSSFDLQVAQKLLNIPATTKVRSLLKGLRSLQDEEPNMRVVVFTQFCGMHSLCVNGLQNAGIQVLEFTGSTSASRRDKQIREFQSAEGGAKAFVITLRAGSVGMTLTAASRVYLMEPCINPATEIQAAGRINRLGQTASVTVIKYAFKDSFETNILRLHRKITAGKVSMSDSLLPPNAVEILTKDI